MTRYALLDKSGKTRLTTEAPNLRAARESLQADRNGTPIPEGWRVIRREVKAAKPKLPAWLKVGDHVKGQRPSGSWAEGTITRVDPFDSQMTYQIDGAVWTSRATTKPTTKPAAKSVKLKELNPGHVTLKMDSGDTLEFWLELDQDGVLDLRGRVQGHLPLYVVSILPDGLLQRHANIALPGLKLNREGEVMM